MSDIPPRRLFPNEGEAQLSAPPLIGSPEFIQTDVVCSQCGYNLRGQARDGRCPECGTDVMEAFRRGKLVYANRDWLIRVRSGVTLVFWGIVVSILLSCAGMIAGIWFMSTFSPHAPPSMPSWAFIPSTIIGIVGIAFAMVVLYRLTAPEPQLGDSVPPQRTGRSRIIIKLAWISVGLQIINTPIYLIWGPDFSSTTIPTPWLIYSMISGGVGAVIYLIIYVQLLLLLRSIARRDASPALGRLFTWVTWGGVSSLAVVMVGGIVMILTTGGVVQSRGFATTMTTTQVAGVTVTTINTTTSAPVTHSGATPTSAPFAHYAGPPMAVAFVILPILATGECFGFVIFVLGIVALIQFYRALSKAITHNVGMVTAFAVIPPPGADSKLSG